MGVIDDGPVMDGINRVMEEERQRPQQPPPSPSRLSSEQLSGMVPFDTRAPAEKANEPLTTEQLSAMVPFTTVPRQSPVSADTRQRLSPAPAQRRLSPVSEPRERLAGQDVGTPRQPQQPQQYTGPNGLQEEHVTVDPPNLRKALGPRVGDRGDFIQMARQARQTGELPGTNGLASSPEQGRAKTAFRSRAQSTVARGGGGSDTLAGRSGSPQPTAARSGGGMFGGGGPGLGYVLGGIGALLQEAGGQQGAAGRFAQTYGDQYRERIEANQTRQLALTLGIPEEIAATAPMDILTPIIGDAYKRRQEGQTPQYEFKGDRWWQVGPDGVQPLTGAPADQTIPGTNIAADSAMGEKYFAFINQGFDHDTALGAASGRYDLRVTDPGIPVKVDQLTNQEVPIQRHGPADIEQRRQLGPTPGRQAQGQPQQAGQTDALGLDPQRDKTLYEMADSGTGLWNVLGDFVGRVGPQFVPGDKQFFNNQREAITTIRTANRGLIRALQQSPRYAEGERKSIEQEIALNPSIGMSPEAWRQSAVAVDRLLRSWWQEDMEDAQSDTLAAEDRQRALASARAIERYLQILGVPGGGQGQPQGQTGGQGEPVTVTSPAEA